MNGLLRRLTRRRAAPADEHPPDSPAASEPADATVLSIEEERPLSEEEQELKAREEELRRRRRDLPAGVDPEQLETPAGEGMRRGALRRRVRYLRSMRELLLRDLGGFYYEVHRAGTQHGGHRDLLETKAGRLAAIDQELSELEGRLGVTHPTETVIREPGIGGACPTCGELHASDADWCWHCGTPLTERARRRAADEVDREIAAREESSRTEAAPPADTGSSSVDPETAELAARVHEVTARDEVTATHDLGETGEAKPRRRRRKKVDASSGEMAATGDERPDSRDEVTAAADERPGSRGEAPAASGDEPTAGDQPTTELAAEDDTVTQGDRRR